MPLDPNQLTRNSAWATKVACKDRVYAVFAKLIGTFFDVLGTARCGGCPLVPIFLFN